MAIPITRTAGIRIASAALILCAAVPVIAGPEKAPAAVPDVAADSAAVSVATVTAPSATTPTPAQTTHKRSSWWRVRQSPRTPADPDLRYNRPNYWRTQVTADSIASR